jgi:hypothetical protein
MNIALDYDGTFTARPTQWLAFIELMRSVGDTVYIVTMRYESECNGLRGSVDSRLRERLVPFICTARAAKKPFCEKLGIPIDIWIDDHPEAVHNDASTIWENVSVEGSTVTPNRGN